jgi:hypothetical protein
MDCIPGLAIWSEHQSVNIKQLREKTMKKQDQESETAKLYEDDRAIVFVEPRKHPSTEYVLRNFAYFLPSWKIIIVHGEENADFMKHIASTIHAHFEFFSCKLSNLPNASYNTLFTHPAFWKLLPTWVLIAQTDTLLLTPAKPFLDDLIAKNIQYCGAPWNYCCHSCKKPLEEGCGHMIDQKRLVTLSPHMVGNGGLSFRNSRRMQECCSSHMLSTPPCKEIISKWGVVEKRLVMEGTSNEDVFFCCSLKSNELPTRLQALDFSIEQVAPVTWGGFTGILSMGAHKPWLYLPTPLVKSILGKVNYS